MNRRINLSYGLNFILSLLLPFMLGAIIIALLGHDPQEAFRELFRGAFVGRLSLGTTLQKWVPVLLTGLAFCITSQVRYFNIGVEGCFYMGALFSAGAGFLITGLPAYLHISLCFLVGIFAGAIWATIPGMLRAWWQVNESCSTIMFNYVAIQFASFMIVNPWSAKSAASQTVPILPSAALSRLMPPSRANSGLFMALTLYIVVFWAIKKTRLGFKLRSTGGNPFFTDYIGFDTRRIVVLATAISGAVGGFAGSIETLGVYGNIIDGFSGWVAFDGMLAALISKNNLWLLPVYSFMIAALKTGALGMERFTGVPKALIDTLIAILIIFLTMENLFRFRFSRREGGTK
ncbi:MAG: ABC transporter permease [Synergistaceae bacterium]|jgi:simple sugar transport system permease protein|nr:ABC transporter permease [Synergistaceae bacterium]